jgi:hypothetical protein
MSALGPHLEQLAAAVAEATRGKTGWDECVEAGLGVGLAFIAGEPRLARFLAEAPGADPVARAEYDEALIRLAEALRAAAAESPDPDEERISIERARLLAGGLAVHVAGRVRCGEAERLPGDRDLLLRYLRSGSREA